MADEKKELQVSSGTALTPMSIIQLAVTQGADVLQLEKLMELQIRWEDRESKKAYDKALASFKAESIHIDKDRHVRYKTKAGFMVDYKHETLGNVLNIITPVLANYGLSLSWRTSIDGNFIVIKAVLAHELGHSESTELQATADSTGSKNALQAVGSTISYLKRYTGLAITGLSAGDMDDDGDKGDSAGQDQNTNQPKNTTKSAPTNQPVDADTTLLDQARDYVGSFIDEGLDAFILMKEEELPQGLADLPDEKQRESLMIVVNNIEKVLLEGK